MYRLFETLNKIALIKAFIAATLVVVLVLIGSRNLQNFDAA